MFACSVHCIFPCCLIQLKREAVILVLMNKALKTLETETIENYVILCLQCALVEASAT